MRLLITLRLLVIVATVSAKCGYHYWVRVTQLSSSSVEKGICFSQLKLVQEAECTRERVKRLYAVLKHTGYPTSTGIQVHWWLTVESWLYVAERSFKQSPQMCERPTELLDDLLLHRKFFVRKWFHLELRLHLLEFYQSFCYQWYLWAQTLAAAYCLYNIVTLSLQKNTIDQPLQNSRMPCPTWKSEDVMKFFPEKFIWETKQSNKNRGQWQYRVYLKSIHMTKICELFHLSTKSTT